MTDRFRIFAWRHNDYQAFDTGPNPAVAYGFIEDLIKGEPYAMRHGYWDGLQVVDISDEIPWRLRPRSLA